MEVLKKDVKKLRGLYEKAVENKVEMFIFKGQEIITGYAKYMLEYIDMLPKDTKK